MTRICSNWRSLAFTTPRLWTSLSVALRQRDGPGGNGLLRTWVERSGGLPLYLELTYGPCQPELNQDIAHQWFISHVVNIISSSAERWHSLHLCLPEFALSELLNRSMPTLHHLQISVELRPLALTVMKPELIPNLRSVSLFGVYQDPRLLALPWGQLTELQFECCLNLEGCLDLLRMCTSLQACSIRVLAYSNTIIRTPTPVVLPSLRSLIAFSGFNEDLGRFLACLELPALEDLELALRVPPTASHQMTLWPKAEVFSLVHRSSNPLRKLSIREFLTEEGDPPECIKTIPNLAILVMVYAGENIIPVSVQSTLQN